MPTVQGGQRGTGNILSNKRKVDMSDKIAYLEPKKSPLMVLLKKISKKEAKNPKFEWLEEESIPRYDQANGAINSSNTSLVVDNGNYFRAGHVIKDVSTGEQMLVDSVSTNTLTVTRGWGNTSAACVSDNDWFTILGGAEEEGSGAPTIKTVKSANKSNYTQIFKEPFDVTRTLDNSELHGGEDLANLRKKHGVYHAKDIERAFWFGEPKKDTSGTHPRRATGGVDYWLSTNRTDIGGSLTEAEFETFCRTAFRYGESTKTVFTAPLITSAVSSWGKSALQLLPKDKTYGLNIQRYVSPHGELNLVNTVLFSEVSAWNGRAYALDLSNLKYRFLQNSDTNLETNIQNNDEDGQKDQYLTEAGLEMRLEKTHALIYGVTGY